MTHQYKIGDKVRIVRSEVSYHKKVLAIGMAQDQIYHVTGFCDWIGAEKIELGYKLDTQFGDTLRWFENEIELAEIAPTKEMTAMLDEVL